MLAERQRMLVLYEQVAGIAPYSEKRPDGEALREFSQILIDYVAAGHFGLYERIAEAKERRQRVVDLARRLYPEIVETTNAVMAFNDALEKVEGDALSDELASRLSGLGENLATRIDLEDQLIAVMLEPRVA
jgi:regulator of sigma D